MGYVKVVLHQVSFLVLLKLDVDSFIKFTAEMLT